MVFYRYKIFPNERVISRFGQAPIRRATVPTAQDQPRGTGHHWGQGHVLGGG